MVKNSPENAVARAQSDGDQLRADACRFPGTLPRSLAAVAAGLGVGAPRRVNGEQTAGAGALKLCKSERSEQKKRGQDFGDAIGKELQSLYDDVVAQPVPDRFLNLLNQLEQSVVSSGLSGGAPGERE